MSETPDATPLQDEPLPPEWMGRWPGVVVSTEDPLKLGRIRARVPQVYGDPVSETEFIPDSDLPWAIPSLSVHDYHAGFAIGDGVWVEFWGGNSAFPIWCGQYLGDGDAPAEFTSSYTPTPKTRILRTTNGHSIEMRWVAGEERIRIKAASGSFIDLLDSPVLGGIKITASTPALRKLELSDFPALSRVAIETPTQKIEAIDLPIPAINILSTGAVNITGAGAVNVAGQGLNLTSTGGAPTVVNGDGTFVSNFTGNALYTFLGTLGFVVSLALSLSSAAVLTVTGGTALELFTAAGLVSLGLAAGAKFKLLDTRFISIYNGHTHSGVTPGVGSTGPPPLAFQVGPAPPQTPLADVSTSNTEAN